jgi:hypothetical protein
MTRPFIATPDVEVLTPMGTVRVALTDAGHAHVGPRSGEWLTWRTSKLHVSVHLFAENDWQPRPYDHRRGSDVYISRDGDRHMASPPKTAELATVAACRDALLRVLADDPDILRRAQYASVNNALGDVEGELNEARATVRDLEGRRRRLLKALAKVKSTQDAVLAMSTGILRRQDIPADHPVRPLRVGEPAEDRVTCGTCGLSWDDAVSTSLTPAPSGRCPFEYYHHHEED